MVSSLSVALFASLIGYVSAQAGAYQQCGGDGWTGATTCVSGYVCTAVSAPYYSQCLPGTAATTAPPAGTGPTTVGTTPTGTAQAPGTTPTLISGMSFVRGVEAPFFHKYLQSAITGKSSDAVLGGTTTAAQFQVTGGQLIQSTASPLLYAWVEQPADSTVKKLKVSWNATQSTFGSFVFSGDTLEWSSPSVTRSQNNAWLICPDSAGNNVVYVNLGAYSYMTPAGCSDQTIHAYTGPYPTE